MPIEFACESCTKLLRVPDGSQGRACQCPSCGTLLEIPDPHLIANVEVQDAAADKNQKHLHIPCPKCQYDLVCDANLLGTKGQCRNCKTIFVISQNPGIAGAAVDALATGLVFSCPKCNQLFEGSEEMRGRKGKCHACGEVFVIQLKAPVGAELTEVRAPEMIPKSTRARPATKSSTSRLASKPATRQASKPTASATPRPAQQPAVSLQPSSPSIQLACAKCEGIMEVPASAAGQTTNCPFCQQLLKIPQPKPKTSRSQTVAQPIRQAPQPASAPFQSQPKSHAQPVADDIWADLGDLSGAANPFAAPQAAATADTWQPTQQRKRLHGLTFANAFRLTFDSLLPNCLLAPVLFGCTAVIGVISVLIAGMVGGWIYDALQPQTQVGTYSAILAPVVLVMIVMHFISNAAVCMTCNTALHVVRGKPVTAQVLFGTGSAYGGMLVLMFAGTGLNMLTRFGIPYLVSGWRDAGDMDTAIAVGGTLLVVMFLVQLGLFFLLATVPFALLDGASLPDAIGTSCSILFGNFLTVFGAIVCGWLLYLAVSLISCGLGLIALIGAPFYLYAAIYHLANK